MQITKEMLKRIIKEELENVMNEGLGGPTHHGEMVGPSNLGAIIQQQEKGRNDLKKSRMDMVNSKGRKLTPDQIKKIQEFQAEIRQAKEAKAEKKAQNDSKLNAARERAFEAMQELETAFIKSTEFKGFNPLEHIDDRVGEGWRLRMNIGTEQGANEAYAIAQSASTKLAKAAEQFVANSGSQEQRNVFQKAFSFLSGKGYKE